MGAPTEPLPARTLVEILSQEGAVRRIVLRQRKRFRSALVNAHRRDGEDLVLFACSHYHARASSARACTREMEQWYHDTLPPPTKSQT